MKKPIEFKDVAHLYLGCQVIDKTDNSLQTLGLIGHNDPHPLFVSSGWRHFSEITPLLHHLDEVPDHIADLEKSYLDFEDPNCYAILTAFRCRMGIDCFNLIENGEAVQRSKYIES